jgi:hypothetical protein
MPTDRFEIDSALYTAIPRGGLTRLAEHRDVSVELISRDYIPHNTDYQSKFSRALVELEVIARVCPSWARNILGVFNRFGVQWAGMPESEQAGGVLQDIISTAAKLLDPKTPDVERMRLAMRLHADAGKVVDGLRFEDREDPADETPMSKPLVNAR